MSGVKKFDGATRSKFDATGTTANLRNVWGPDMETVETAKEGGRRMPRTKVIVGDVRTALAGVPDEHFHTVVTSPPYWGLRDYGAEDMIGLEESFDAHLRELVKVFREVRRVLRKDGTLWLNYGDSYTSGGRTTFRSSASENKGHDVQNDMARPPTPDGLKAKDLMMLPARVAMALQADGWWLRSEIVWAKPNPMPESVTDRPTSAHEKLYLMSRAPRYFYDAEAVRTPATDSTMRRLNQSTFETQEGGPKDPKTGNRSHRKVLENLKARTVEMFPEAVEEPKEGPPKDNNRRNPKGFRPGDYVDHQQDPRQATGESTDGREYGPGSLGVNLRNVWHIPTHAYPEAHFACVDDETEALTVDGWRRHDEIAPGDRIAGYAPGAMRCMWDVVEAVAAYPVVDERMVRMHGRGVDQLLTRDHRCLIERRSGVQVVVRADALKRSHKTLVACQWVPDGEPFPERLAALVGWTVTEGTLGKDVVHLYQSGDANPDYCDEIRALLDAEGAQYREHMRKREWRGREVLAHSWRITGAVANTLLSLCDGKRLPSGFLRWNDMALRALWDALMKGDGHFREGGRATFVQKSEALIGQVQALACRLGYATTLRQRSTKTWALYKTVARSRMLRSASGGLVSEVSYTGTVWCPQTRTGYWVARRNGRVFITGNTFPPKLVEPCIKAGTSEHGCCAECGAPWVRKMDVAYTKATPNGPPKEEMGVKGYTERMEKYTTTVGWEPGCACDAPVVPCRVLDPFGGAGTTAMVADRLGRDATLVEINPEYAKQAVRRLEGDAGLFSNVEVDE